MLLISGSAEEICRCMQFNKWLIFGYLRRRANTDNTEGEKVILQCTYIGFLNFNSNKRNSNSKYIANLLILHVVHIRGISLTVERDFDVF